ncbi:MAG: hypothetical protein V7L00_23475 [Nostoc sp.]|uniref:hypothetical protein n=1 Tax=Nostoc sp. TaxID=1180 RepID=UPI002FFC5192
MAILIGQSDDPNQAGVLGEGVIVEAGTGVYGRDRAGKGNGVIGFSENGRGVWGHSKTGFGLLGESVSGRGVVASSETDYGLRAHSTKSAGIRGSSDEGRGVEGWATNSEGIVGISTNGNGVWGQTEGAGVGVLGTSKSGIGVYGKGGRLAGFFEGDVEVTGDIRLTNADCAEDFDIVGLVKVEPGTVMVIDSEGALRESDCAYDKRVAGVISGAGKYKPGIVLDKKESSNNRMPIALLGKVYCKVDAQYGAIEVGDLLTTSPTPGHAMRTSDPFKAFGAVIGKALRPLEEGQGLIPILIALQ